MSKLYDKLPPGVRVGLKSHRVLKNWARAVISLIVMLILMTATKSDHAMGSAAFFGLIANMIIPPYMALSIFGMAMVTMGLGMCLGWAWGCAAWAAALSVRDTRSTHAKMAAVAAAGPGSPQEALSAAIFRGEFLHAGSSAIFGVFIFIGAYTFGWMRSTRPKLTLTTVFGTIILDMVCTIGPLFPMSDYMLATNLVKPAAVYMAVGTACTILLFPQSLSHLVLTILVKHALAPVQGLLKIHDEILTTLPSDHERWHALATKTRGFRDALVGGSAHIQAQSKMLQLEISHGRISAGQLGALVKKTRELCGHAFGLGSFVLMEDSYYREVERHRGTAMPHLTSTAKRDREALLDAATREGRSLTDLMPALAEETSDLRATANAALGGAAKWLDTVNNTRWKKWPTDAPTRADHEKHLAELKAALKAFRSTKHFDILERYKDLFDPVSGRIRESEIPTLSSSVRGLFRCFVFTTSLIAFCVSLVSFLELVLQIEQENPKNKFQFPGKFVQSVVENANDSTDGENGYDLGVQDHLRDNADEQTAAAQFNADLKPMDSVADLKKSKRRKYAKIPDARDPRNIFQRFGRRLAKLYKTVTNPNGLYALKYAAVTIALWTPSVCNNSAKFYYANRGLWGLIMAQFGMGVVTGEQIMTFLERMCGTLAGIVLGMVVWYIGAPGRGNGNAYGITAACTVFLMPFIFMRIVSTPQQTGFWLMTAVTTVFIVGYSWVDSKVPQTANQGTGATVSGRRAVLVLIGFAAAFIVMMFPHPTSAKVLIRQGLSKNIASLGELYGLQVSSFEKLRSGSQKDKQDRMERLRRRILGVFNTLQGVKGKLHYATAEPGIQGPWPKEDYLELIKVQGDMLASAAVSCAAFQELNPEWCRALDRSSLMEPTFIADCFSLFALLRHSLRGGAPLPPTIPIFERLLYHRKSTAARAIVRTAASGSQLALGTGSQLGLGTGSQLGLGTGSQLGLSTRPGSRQQRSRPVSSVPSVPDASSEKPLVPAISEQSSASAMSEKGPVSDASEKPPVSDAAADARARTTDTEGTNGTVVGDGADGTEDTRSVGDGDDDQDAKDSDHAFTETLSDTFTWQSCHDEQFAVYATALIGIMHIVSALNQMHGIVLDLVGEREIDGFDDAQERWARANDA